MPQHTRCDKATGLLIFWQYLHLHSAPYVTLSVRLRDMLCASHTSILLTVEGDVLATCSCLARLFCSFPRFVGVQWAAYFVVNCTHTTGRCTHSGVCMFCLVRRPPYVCGSHLLLPSTPQVNCTWQLATGVVLKEMLIACSEWWWQSSGTVTQAWAPYTTRRSGDCCEVGA
jgi:hypothetical protein